ncbi:MAG: SDR family oxidoreductase, partial [Oricola sp.]
VNVASVAGKEGNPNQAAYSASKAALIAFTKSLAKELLDYGILANCIAPTIVKTELLEQIGKAQLDTILAKIPLGRAGLPEEVAAAIAWLASDECSFSTGAVFDLSGGRATY